MTLKGQHWKLKPVKPEILIPIHSNGLLSYELTIKNFKLFILLYDI